MIRLATILALAAAAFAPAAASANSYNYSYPGQRDAMTNPVVAAAAAWGSAWLEAHGKAECATKAGGRVMMAPDLGSTVDNWGGQTPATGRELECDTWISTDIVAIGNTLTETGFWIVCITVTHEEAHTAGMTHEEMASSGLEAAWSDACTTDFAASRAATVRVVQMRARQARRKSRRKVQ